MHIRFYFCLIFSFLLLSCSHKKVFSESNPDLQIVRFDSNLYHYLTANKKDSALISSKSFLDEWGEKVIHIGKSDSAGFYKRLHNYFSEPTLMALFRDEQVQFADISDINTELSAGMETLLQHLKTLKQPKIYMHVSGLNQNVIVNDEFLSLSADKYMGSDYPLYQEFFYDYQRQLMSPDRIVPDYLLGFLMANFPFKGNDEVLLDKMLYEGKLRYLISQALPNRKAHEIVAYTPQQYDWCKNHESHIWKTILENQHLFQPDFVRTELYLKEAPYTPSLPSESPGRVGIWLGYQIISAYMKHQSKTTWQELMEQTESLKLLQESKYKP